MRRGTTGTNIAHTNIRDTLVAHMKPPKFEKSESLERRIAMVRTVRLLLQKVW